MNKFKKPRVPYCFSCFDKGWNSYIANRHLGADFMGDLSSDKTILQRRYCGCKGGEKLRKLEGK